MTARRARTDLRRLAVGLLDQQIWCWGRDVARTEGNVLLGLGMCRFRAAEPAGTTLYTGRVAGGAEVWLWGFGLLYCAPNLGGLYLRRYRFDPLLVALPPARPVHRPEDVGPLTRPTTARQRATAGALVRAAAGWAAAYEHWVAETFGTTYRETALAARGKPPAVPAREMAGAWERLAKKAPRLAGPRATAAGPWAAVLAGLRPRPVAAPRPARPYGRATDGRRPT